jgi:hypothetical protein
MPGARFPEKGFGVKGRPRRGVASPSSSSRVPFSDGFRACAIQPLDPPLALLMRRPVGT